MACTTRDLFVRPGKHERALHVVVELQLRPAQRSVTRLAAGLAIHGKLPGVDFLVTGAALI